MHNDDGTVKVVRGSSLVVPHSTCDLCRPVSDLGPRRSLRSSSCGELLVPQASSAPTALSLLNCKSGSHLHYACHHRIICLLSINHVKSFLLGHGWTGVVFEGFYINFWKWITRLTEVSDLTQMKLIYHFIEMGDHKTMYRKVASIRALSFMFKHEYVAYVFLYLPVPCIL